MFLDFDGTLVNLDHVAQVLPYVPGGLKQLVVILSNGNRVAVKDGERAVELYRLMANPTKPPAQWFMSSMNNPADFDPRTTNVATLGGLVTILPPDEPPTAGVTANLPKAPKPPKKGTGTAQRIVDAIRDEQKGKK